MTKRRLSTLIADERHAAPDYLASARAVEKRSPKLAATYRSIARDEKRHLKMLEAAKKK